MATLAWPIIVVLLVFVWMDMLRAREIANGMAKRCCFVTGVWTLRLQRSFTFEYSRLGTDDLLS